MKKSDVQLLLLVAGLLMAFCSWYFVYNANMDKMYEVQLENESLQTEIKKLEELDAQKQKFIDDTASMKEECDTIVSYFPAGLLTEDEIMYYNNMELATMNEIVVPSIGMGVPTEIPYVGELAVGEYTLQDDGIKMYSSQTNLSFTTTYKGLKNTIGYIYQMPGRKAITSVSLSAGSDGYLMGSMSVDFYYMDGTPLLYTPIDIPAVPLGKDNIFGVLEENTEDEADTEEE